MLVGSSHSKYETLKYGVLQGSVLGLILFSIYNSPIGEIIEKHNICYHLYADDGQLYLAFSPKDYLQKEEVKEKMMKCAKDVKSFLTFNKMKQNDDKTEFFIIGTPAQLKKVNFKDIHICEAEVSQQAHNHGIIFDKEMNSKAQINISHMNYNVAFIHIMTSTEPSVILAVTKYIFTCFNKCMQINI